MALTAAQSQGTAEGGLHPACSRIMSPCPIPGNVEIGILRCIAVGPFQMDSSVWRWRDGWGDLE